MPRRSRLYGRRTSYGGGTQPHRMPSLWSQAVGQAARDPYPWQPQLWGGQYPRQARQPGNPMIQVRTQPYDPILEMIESPIDTRGETTLTPRRYPPRISVPRIADKLGIPIRGEIRGESPSVAGGMAGPDPFAGAMPELDPLRAETSAMDLAPGRRSQDSLEDFFRQRWTQEALLSPEEVARRQAATAAQQAARRAAMDPLAPYLPVSQSVPAPPTGDYRTMGLHDYADQYGGVRRVGTLGGGSEYVTPNVMEQEREARGLHRQTGSFGALPEDDPVKQMLRDRYADRMEDFRRTRVPFGERRLARQMQAGFDPLAAQIAAGQRPLTEDQQRAMFGGGLPGEELLPYYWDAMTGAGSPEAMAAIRESASRAGVPGVVLPEAEGTEPPSPGFGEQAWDFIFGQPAQAARSRTGGPNYDTPGTPGLMRDPLFGGGFFGFERLWDMLNRRRRQSR